MANEYLADGTIVSYFSGEYEPADKAEADYARVKRPDGSVDILALGARETFHLPGGHDQKSHAGDDEDTSAEDRDFETYEQLQALSDYKNYGHAEANDYLRGGNFFKGQARQDGKALGETLKAAFDNPEVYKELPKAQVVFRGISNDGVYKALSRLRPGDTFSDKGLVSVSRRQQIADYASNQGGAHVMIELELPKGTRYLSGNPQEAEYILRPGAKYEVTNRYLARGDKYSNPYLELRVRAVKHGAR